ncbi:MAG: hypothetical protein HY769_06605 [Candidatus Stahlbacteria bacterium]|nr:hypothetical protein [Candidatus Stahlbacteria bacterium]
MNNIEPKNLVEVEIETSAPFILLSSVMNKPGIGAKICESLALHNINIESFITVSVPGKERTDILIEVAQEDLDMANYLLSEITKEVEAKGLLSAGINVEELAKVIIRSPNLSKQAGIGAKIFGIFSKYNINVWAFIGTTAGKEFEIKVLVEKRQLDKHPEIVDEIKKEMKL